MRVRNVQKVTEIWRCQCLRCLRAWQDMYEACYVGDAVAWRFCGLPAQPPWVDRTCGECGSLRVKTLRLPDRNPTAA